MGYLYPHLPPHLPSCGVATTPSCGVLQHLPTRGVVPYHGMIWDLNGIFHGMVYSWDVPWDGIFLGPPIPYIPWDPIKILFLEVILGAILGATFGSHIAAAE